MADDLIESLKGFGKTIEGGAKALTGAANWVGTKLGVGTPPPAAPMPGRLPLGEVPKVMPVMKTPTGDFRTKKF